MQQFSQFAKTTVTSVHASIFCFFFLNENPMRKQAVMCQSLNYPECWAEWLARGRYSISAPSISPLKETLWYKAQISFTRQEYPSSGCCFISYGLTLTLLLHSCAQLTAAPLLGKLESKHQPMTDGEYKKLIPLSVMEMMVQSTPHVAQAKTRLYLRHSFSRTFPFLHFLQVFPELYSLHK